MPLDLLKYTLSHIELFCQANDMVLFYGQVVDDFGFLIQWDGAEGERGLDELMVIAKGAGVKLLHIQRVYNDVEIDEETLAELLVYVDEEGDGEGKEEILKEVALVEETKGQLVSLTLSFFYQGGCYSWEQKAAWEPSYSFVSDFLYGSDTGDDDDDEDDDNDNDDDEYNDDEDDGNSDANESTGEDQESETIKDRSTGTIGENSPDSSLLSIFGSRDTLSPETIEQYARKLIQTEKYVRAKHMHERRTIAKQLLQAEGFSTMREWWIIEERAEELYRDEVVPQREKEYIEKIKAYLKSTDKPSMAGAARIVDMDARRVGPYWEKAKNSLL
ncbi:MAG: hypothetical protein EOO10_13340 [Chitinophagaceae bacterium]|nr:MAG: hypothetical protein EOO10_13340 [Chitinophagaceae bacterium]